MQVMFRTHADLSVIFYKKNLKFSFILLLLLYQHTEAGIDASITQIIVKLG